MYTKQFLLSAIMPVTSKVNPDITEERGKVGFNVDEFTNWYHGGADKVKEKRFLGAITADNNSMD